MVTTEETKAMFMSTSSDGTDASMESETIAFHKASKGDACSESETSETASVDNDLRRMVNESHFTRAQDAEHLINLQRKMISPKKLEDKERESVQRIMLSLSESLKSQKREAGPRISLEDEFKLDRAPTCRSKGPSDYELKFTKVLRNPTAPQLYEHALKYEEDTTSIISSGALATLSGAKTGRSPKDKRIVWEEKSSQDIWWCENDGENSASPNIAMDEESFSLNRETAIDYLKSRNRVYVVDGFAGWDTEHRIKIRVICAKPYHALFISNLLVTPSESELKEFDHDQIDFTVINAGQFPCNRFIGYMTSSTSIDVNFKKKEMVILGTMYAGEMKKGIFTIMNYLMPKKGVLSLHSGCNIGSSGVTLFFGLSGTGKTTLSTESARKLIGDDEHCWDDKGVFNIEGGCYAKCIGLKEDREPEIFSAIHFGTVLENVVFDADKRKVDFDDGSITENTRAAYPIEHIANAKIPCVGPHPTNIIMLCCDAFGVLPPVSRLTLSQALYYFISGYTAKVAGTEVGVTEPQATFSACFGSAFIVWHPLKYASLLAEKMAANGANAWLINTGWTSGSYGTGHRIKLSHTRAIVDAVHSGELLNAKYATTPTFGLNVPTSCTGVPENILDPRNTWKDVQGYDRKLLDLAERFRRNFDVVCSSTDKFCSKTKLLLEEIRKAGPQTA
eukprot:CAMPEP_0198234456 /NCGR_PEP_ID=MMETSP1446-20131203/471_1 /TAXON_ID=1461542 ORGANISM="Unidentified sp, Strain CCMP2111" /NCGR_SAMPLE_ID=MMETSP1446 /ASSEMBLY_ACC=CAM_ASM_001112 /LENGTH=676 /DNA_ID=CAMNT_0043915241 /DNA_START=50 /DNA_END=2080 /DNA_ORIENTATION=+